MFHLRLFGPEAFNLLVDSGVFLQLFQSSPLAVQVGTKLTHDKGRDTAFIQVVCLLVIIIPKCCTNDFEFSYKKEPSFALRSNYWIKTKSCTKMHSVYRYQTIIFKTLQAHFWPNWRRILVGKNYVSLTQALQVNIKVRSLYVILCRRRFYVDSWFVNWVNIHFADSIGFSGRFVTSEMWKSLTHFDKNKFNNGWIKSDQIFCVTTSQSHYLKTLSA